MPYELPKGWVKTTLGEILPLRYGKARSEHHGEPRENTSVYGSSGVLGEFHRALTSGPTLIVGRKGNVGSVYYSAQPCWPIDTVYYSEATPDLNLPFFKYLLEPLELRELDRSTAVPGLSRNDYNSLRVRIPPLREQERIVAKLDALLSRLAAGEAAAGRALERLKRYRAAVLHAAVTGELTCGWRKTHKPDETGAQLLKRLLQERRARWEEAELKRLHAVGKPRKDEKWKERYPEPTELDVANLSPLPRGWAWASLQQLGFIMGGLTKNPRRATLPLKMPYLRVGNVYANELRLDVIKTIGVEKDELGKLLLEKGDLLIVEGNGSKDQIGRLAIWDGSIEKCVHQNHIIKVRLVEKALGAWILSWLLSPPGRLHVEKVASSTTGLYTLSVSKVGHLPIPLPPFTEQMQIASEVDRRLVAADRLTTTLSRQLERTRATRQSVLREAFTGKLVPQDPKDEPASVLLDRICAAREVEARKPKAKRMPKSKTKTTRRPLLDVLKEQKKPITPEQLFEDAGFQPVEADLFYRELATLRELIREKKPSDAEARAWPNRALVLLDLKKK